MRARERGGGCEEETLSRKGGGEEEMVAGVGGGWGERSKSVRKRLIPGLLKSRKSWK